MFKSFSFLLSAYIYWSWCITLWVKQKHLVWIFYIYEYYRFLISCHSSSKWGRGASWSADPAYCVYILDSALLHLNSLLIKVVSVWTVCLNSSNFPTCQPWLSQFGKLKIPIHIRIFSLLKILSISKSSKCRCKCSLCFILEL